jgi:hypothetical protein
MVGLLRHSQRKRGGNGLARPTATALRLDSTEVFVRNRLGLSGNRDLPPLAVPPTVSHFLPLPGGVAPGE